MARTMMRPASRTTALVLDAVRAAIVGGELGPGEQVRQQEWAARCGVSRPPVREALEILSNEGLLTHGFHQGYFVTKFNASEMKQLYTMRLLLEPEVIASIEWPDDHQLEVLGRMAAAIEAPATDGRPDLAMQALVDFYLAIYRLSPLSLIIDEIERLWIRTAPYRAWQYDVTADPQGALIRFEEIVTALAARDRETLARLLLAPTLRGAGRAQPQPGT